MSKQVERYDLASRSYSYAKNIRKFIRQLPLDICNIEDAKQLARSSGSVGANYIEANESFSKKDFYYRLKICRKEAKESKYWLQLLSLVTRPEMEELRNNLIGESEQLVKIFSSIIQNQKN